MPIRYCMFESWEYSEDAGSYRTFGICALRDGDCAARVADVSLDPDFVAQLARRCTRSGLDPLHLPDVVEDALNAPA